MVSNGVARQGIAILGATGSIGTSCLSVLRACPERFDVVVLAAHQRWQLLARQCQEFRPRHAVLTGLQADEVDLDAFPKETKVWFSSEMLTQLVTDTGVQLVVAAIVGAAGLASTWEAVRAGKTVAVANKETFVVAGPLINDLAETTGAKVIPVDSEHSAIFQALHAGHREDVERIILTASGGPFRTWSSERLATASIQDALAHPTWNMGPKITIDSATMMNKALEVIEARWLFDLEADQIDVVVHPQSIVHSMVEFRDGSVIAQLSPPDMRLPIQYAMFYPERLPGVSPKMDFTRRITFDFEPPDLERFPALGLGFEVARQGGTAGAVLNAANEVAVQRFLEGTLSFSEIPALCRSVLSSHEYVASPSLEEILQMDRWAREEAFRWQLTASACS